MVPPHFLLSKGPLRNIWVAAYFCNKLKKDQIVRTSISSSVDKIIPEVHISYRVLAQLLLGVVRIFSKKVEILYHDCNAVLTSACKTKASSTRHVSVKAFVAPYLCKEASAPQVYELDREARHVKGDAVTHDETVCEQISSTKSIPSSHEVFGSQICFPDKSMAAARRRCAIVVPEKLTLDSFEVVVPDECDSVGINQCHTIEGEGHDSWEFFPNKVGPNSTRLHSLLVSTLRRRAQILDSVLLVLHHILSTGRNDIDLHINELYRLSILERIEVPEIDIAHLEDHDNISESTQSIDMKMDFNAKGEVDQHMKKLSKPIHLDFEEPAREKECTKASPAKIHDKDSLPCTSGASSPEITIRTPAKKEQPRSSRKRKCLYDEMLILSNMVLREGIHNPSDLVVKRRKTPHTSLESWKAYIFADLERAFMEQQIPCKPLEHRDFSVKKTSSGEVQISKETTTTPNDFHQPDYHDGSLEQKQSSLVDALESGYSSEIQVAAKLDERPEKPSLITASDLERDLAIRSLDEAAIQKGTDFSVRTRFVARYLCQSFQNLKGQNKILNLSRVLDKRKRGACATFFYETLVLKTQGCLEVIQEVPYADIIVSAKPNLFA